MRLTRYTLEPAGDEGKGIEFTVYSSSRPEHHQVKRQLTGKGVWSLGELDSQRVLSDFYQKLQDPTFQLCVHFLSRCPSSG